ncbi:hypothetical protein NSIN_20285 [Nitrosotalea sinensis]|uniref:Uncharacterized protein n=1 Tax=Nitrosotalea sinensis TaxID=1499975 RepID=A0A2H1EFF6_9ARCH|nr:hypothetical protein [Candidatus Nitrosotalea sinensis]SHO44270.1 hypothetical protein NSIN_20285 [Candidatus Nitrosotalea sinensis]
MNHRLQQYLVIEIGKHSPVENPVGRYLVKEGKNLPNSVTEDIGGFSLCPSYSAKQQRRIHRISVSASGRNFRNKTRGWDQ